MLFSQGHRYYLAGSLSSPFSINKGEEIDPHLKGKTGRVGRDLEDSIIYFLIAQYPGLLPANFLAAIQAFPASSPHLEKRII
jgi:hypothetical protein